MSQTPSPLSESNIILRLRAAGCVFAEDEAEILISTAQTSEELAEMVEKRIAGFPLEHVVGWAEFYGLRIAVDPGVFVPRRRTEFLAQQAIALSQPTSVVIDLCCGSGAVGAALISAYPTVELYASDIDPAAVICARRNLVSRGGQVFEGDLFVPLPESLQGRVDVLVCNAPYVPHDAIDMMPAEARIYEAQVALDGGSDGLDIQRRVTAAAPFWLASGGYLLIETSERQASQTAELFAKSGLLTNVVRCDDLDATVVIGRKLS